MPLDHFSINVPPTKLEDVIKFLTTSLAHFGFKEHMRPIPEVVGMGDSKSAYFWINGRLPENVDPVTMEGLLKATHVAFTSETVEDVKKFHEEGLKAGGSCNGPPGPRPHFHPGYYAAFVRDPACGINFEVVLHSYSGDSTN